jgi:arginase
MPLHYALAAGDVEADRLAFVGLRDVDPAERATLRALGACAFTMSDIDRLGMAAVADAALAAVADTPGALHLSFDLDAIDPSEAPGVGTPVRGGISYREAHLLMETIAAAGVLGSLEVTEINPILDRGNQTATLAVELICSALGKTVL